MPKRAVMPVESSKVEFRNLTPNKLEVQMDCSPPGVYSIGLKLEYKEPGERTIFDAALERLGIKHARAPARSYKKIISEDCSSLNKAARVRMEGKLLGIYKEICKAIETVNYNVTAYSDGHIDFRKNKPIGRKK